jgi:hypothetical protein
VKVGYGAGTREFKGRANALRVVLADVVPGAEADSVVLLACDIDDMSAEYLAAAATAAYEQGALDVTLLPILMKKGRPGTRIELICAPDAADRLEVVLLTRTTTIGVRRTVASRRILPRLMKSVSVFGHDVSLKVVTLPDGSVRVKPEFDDVDRVAASTGKAHADVYAAAINAGEGK